MTTRPDPPGCTPSVHQLLTNKTTKDLGRGKASGHVTHSPTTQVPLGGPAWGACAPWWP